MTKPTKKQKEYARQISEVLGICLPKEKTKKAYSDFISRYEEEAHEADFNAWEEPDYSEEW